MIADWFMQRVVGIPIAYTGVDDATGNGTANELEQAGQRSPSSPADRRSHAGRRVTVDK